MKNLESEIASEFDKFVENLASSQGMTVEELLKHDYLAFEEDQKYYKAWFEAGYKASLKK